MQFVVPSFYMALAVYSRTYTQDIFWHPISLQRINQLLQLNLSPGKTQIFIVSPILVTYFFKNFTLPGPGLSCYQSNIAILYSILSLGSRIFKRKRHYK